MLSVKEAVLSELIAHYPYVSNARIERASTAHSLSGLRRFRELKAEGIVDYEFCHQGPWKNHYLIKTPKDKLEKALVEMRQIKFSFAPVD